METGRIDVNYLNSLASRVTSETDFADGRGDVRLIIKKDHLDGSQLQAFLVSSAAMMRACKPWERMLDGPFAEGQPGHPKILDFTDDNYKALRIMMNVIHLRFGDVPPKVSLSALARLAVLTDKYNLTALISPWIRGWLEHLLPTIQERGNEPCWLWISWEFGLSDIFDHVSHRLCTEASFSHSLSEEDAPLEESRAFLFETQVDLNAKEQGTSNESLQEELTAREYHLVGPSGVPISEALPPGGEETVLAKRRAIIAKILEMVYGYFSNLRLNARNRVVRSLDCSSVDDDVGLSSFCRNWKYDCLLLQIGSLTCALESLGLWPEKDPNDIHTSPKQLHKLLTRIQLSDCQRHDIGKSGMYKWADSDSEIPFGSTCGSFSETFKTAMDMAFQNSGVNEAQAKHMEAQRRKMTTLPSDWKWSSP